MGPIRHQLLRLVKPQFENQQAIQQLQQQQLQFQGTQGMMPGQGGPLAADDMAPTGHRLGGFFNTRIITRSFTRRPAASASRRGRSRVRSRVRRGRLWAPGAGYGQGIFGTGYGQAGGFVP